MLAFAVLIMCHHVCHHVTPQPPLACLMSGHMLSAGLQWCCKMASNHKHETGYHGRTHADCWMSCHGLTEVAAKCFRSPAGQYSGHSKAHSHQGQGWGPPPWHAPTPSYLNRCCSSCCSRGSQPRQGEFCRKGCCQWRQGEV